MISLKADVFLENVWEKHGITRQFRAVWPVTHVPEVVFPDIDMFDQFAPVGDHSPGTFTIRRVPEIPAPLGDTDGDVGWQVELAGHQRIAVALIYTECSDQTIGVTFLKLPRNVHPELP